MSRDDAIRIVKERGDDTPHSDIDKFCNFINISKEDFYETIEPFRNLDIWTEKNGEWEIKDFIINDWIWKCGILSRLSRRW